MLDTARHRSTYIAVEDVNDVEKLTFINCVRFDDGCLSQLAKHVSLSVKELTIAGCGDVTDLGLEQILSFR